ncbi:MAG: tRNA pseudouridine(38-40) synthase TruA [Deltaproteobacteria bacterium]|jgi:tRNA pseudouridine38-40 synthase|nr:tRNA pseudouridine(38-40) synthase TruA [Deltaproteobacteria bacterium]
MARIKLTVAYLGTGFAGWQIQSFNQGAVARTVQGVLEEALRLILGVPVRVHSAGRTDAGVHADRQVAHFDTPEKECRVRRWSGFNWQSALHRLLPPDISILKAEEVPPSFHARFDCTGKVYAYHLWLERNYIPPKIRAFAWACGTADFNRMQQAANMLPGRRDFAGFQNAGSPQADTVRTLYSITPFFPGLPGEPASPPANADGRQIRYLAWRFHGDGFLKQMVRNLMGFIVWAGQGKIQPEDAGSLFAGKHRRAANFPTAPAWGLTLTDVLY